MRTRQTRPATAVRRRRLLLVAALCVAVVACDAVEGSRQVSDGQTGETDASSATETAPAGSSGDSATQTEPASGTEPAASTGEDGAATAAAVPDGLDGATVQGVTATPDGMLAVGGDEGGAAAWISRDGTSWEPARVERGGGAGAMFAVGSDGDRAVAFGRADADTPTAWATTDGRRWRVDGRGRRGIGRNARVNAVAAGPSGWLAVGDITDPEAGEATAGVLWTSENGRRWTRVDRVRLDAGTLSDVAVAGDTVVVTGFDVDGGRIWVRRGDGALEPVRGANLEAATVEAVAALGDRFVALGRGLADLRPLAWTSDDGVTWRRHDVAGDVFAADEQIHGMAAVGDRLVAVGTAPEGGVLWSTSDGTTWTRGMDGADTGG